MGRQTLPFYTGQIRHSVAFKKVKYLAVTYGMQREHVKPLHASYVKNGEGETGYHTGLAGLLCLSPIGEGETGWRERRGGAVVPEPQSFLDHPHHCHQHYFFFYSTCCGQGTYSLLQREGRKAKLAIQGYLKCTIYSIPEPESSTS